MTLNEIIEWARANDVDFDWPVLIPHHDEVDIEQLDTGFRTNGLVIRIF